MSSNVHKDLDGACWGAWATLTGWIQSWIVATQVLVYEKNSYWDMTKDQSRGFRASAFQVIDKMLGAK